jgi:hypothetical protein
MDATISGIYAKYNTTQRCGRSTMDSTMIQGFVVVQGKLYKKSISGVLERCVTPKEGQIILQDIHAGVCGHRASSRAIAAKAFCAGFYWLTAVEDAKDIVRQCEACQRFASRPHAPIAELQSIPLSWPFAQWGLGHLQRVNPFWCPKWSVWVGPRTPKTCLFGWVWGGNPTGRHISFFLP